MRRLILFDIDGTLMRCGPQVRPIFVGALEEIYGVAGSLEDFSFSGKTDPQIVLELQRRAGFDDAEIWRRLPRMRELYSRSLEARLDVGKMQLLSGVLPLLQDLERRGDVVLALLTGNWEPCAVSKLARFDLEPFFGFGAFGEDSANRRELVPAALERAERHCGRRFAPEEALIVGDSERDVDCARASGLPSLAVATGFTSASDLAASGADWVVEDLEQASSAFEAFLA